MKWNTSQLNELCDVLLSLQSTKEMKSFLRDLMTEEELVECSQRWVVARLLDEKVSYEQIQKKTGLSSTTVARISRWLQKGAGGYQIALRHMNQHSHSS